MRRSAFKLYMMVFSLLLILISGSGVLAAENSGERGMVAVYGEAELEAEPDQATVIVGVVTRSDNAEKAVQENADRMSALLAAIDEFGIEDSSVVTGGYHIYPVEYEDRREFRVSNRLEVTLEDLSSLGEFIDAMAEAGANSVESVIFKASKAEDVKMKALEKAIEQAGKKAQVMAQAAGLRLGEILSITEESGSYTPSVMGYGSALAVARDAATVIRAEKIKINARVKIEYVLLPGVE